ncbi:MAG TPA: Fic family protein [Bryobacteraceae bacterium]|nr:Fic family protein [Bryobacteraceae bacterium]
MAAGYKWHPIRDLDGNSQSLTDGELEALGRVWRIQKTELEERQVLVEFEHRLRREWAIETGIIEDLYTLDGDVTTTLIERGINAGLIPTGATNRDPTLVARLIQDHYVALEAMFDFVADRRRLSTGYITELHAALLRDLNVHASVDQSGWLYERRLEKEQYKSEPNSPARPDGTIHEYCPPEHVASEMNELIRMHGEHQSRGVPVEVEAAWLHHRFTEIHPFADGNGRVARAIASLVFIRDGWFPLVIRRADRARYIDSLGKADAGNLRPLIALFVESQRTTLIAASEIAYDGGPVASTHDAVLAVRHRLLQKENIPPSWIRAKENAGVLLGVATECLREVGQDLTNEIGSLRRSYKFGVTESDATAGLVLNAGRPDELVIFFHQIGQRFIGMIGVTATLVIDENQRIPIDRSSFQINYEEDVKKAKARFTPWLDGVIVRALDAWRRTL